ncbi:MAG: nuclear transport factor 2 family protein [Deltaproteobacteria bacterium]|nr:nuclear transport factor 2 family protein [Deltaproteobacteria bacterium]
MKTVFLSLAAMLAMGCGAKLIPGTKLADTPDNRSIVSVVEKYRRAMEARDVDGLLALASKDYKEDGGTPGAADDYGHEGLKRVLRDRFAKVRALRLQVVVGRVEFSGSRARIEYRWEMQCQYTHKDKVGWHVKTDDNRFELERVGGQWLFTSGL